ncbi:adenosylcobinamide-GDP ribazoletransferase [Gordonia defluvii]|uniref:Adenosylcobinamide-GDP ribazoletransferase n=1 Tax=Gordonia defluvii TaxID=283718 RepID=A0ABP6LCM2_9ACTN|nr:adenosylcobinamide-GDP ribazoletransferase [Gordonia sp. UBA5067]
MTPESRIGPLGALRLAASWLTVAPVGTIDRNIDRAAGAAVIAVTPFIGTVVGVLAAGTAFGFSHTQAPDLLIGGLVVAVLALVTRSMHLDGLADTADGLGCYGDPQRVRQVMRDGSTGPFGVVALIAVLGTGAVCIGTLAHDRAWYAIGFAVVASRLAAVIGCRRRLPAADPTGFGALVAGTQSWSIPLWVAVGCAAAYPLGPRGFIAIALVVAGAWAFTAHCSRRFGGINGDVLGASIELSCAATLIVLTL